MSRTIHYWLRAQNDRHFSLTFSHVRNLYVGILFYRDVRGVAHNVAECCEVDEADVISQLEKGLDQ